MRIIRSDGGSVTPVSGWLDAGSLTWNHGPELTADSAGAVLFVSRPDGDAGWRAVRIRWDGTLEAERPASSLASPGLAVARHGGGFIGFQNLQGGVGGGEVRVTEWDAALVPVQAWQWQNILLQGDLCLQPGEGHVRLTGNAGDRPGYGVWRPLRINRFLWNAPVRGVWMEATGPAGLQVRVDQGDSPANFTDYTTMQFDPPGPAVYSAGGPGTITFQKSNLTPAVGFFRLETPLLHRVSP